MYADVKTAERKQKDMTTSVYIPEASDDPIRIYENAESYQKLPRAVWVKVVGGLKFRFKFGSNDVDRALAAALFVLGKGIDEGLFDGWEKAESAQLLGFLKTVTDDFLAQEEKEGMEGDMPNKTIH